MKLTQKQRKSGKYWRLVYTEYINGTGYVRSFTGYLHQVELLSNLAVFHNCKITQLR